MSRGAFLQNNPHVQTFSRFHSFSNLPSPLGPRDLDWRRAWVTSAWRGVSREARVLQKTDNQHVTAASCSSRTCGRTRGWGLSVRSGRNLRQHARDPSAGVPRGRCTLDSVKSPVLCNVGVKCFLTICDSPETTEGHLFPLWLARPFR